MGLVTLEGVFMNAEIKTTTFEGVSKTALYLDIYQKDSPVKDKLVQLKTDDLTLMNEIKENYDFGSVVNIKATLSAYKNQTYFKLLEFVS